MTVGPTPALLDHEPISGKAAAVDPRPTRQTTTDVEGSAAAANDRRRRAVSGPGVLPGSSTRGSGSGAPILRVSGPGRLRFAAGRVARSLRSLFSGSFNGSSTAVQSPRRSGPGAGLSSATVSSSVASDALASHGLPSATAELDVHCSLGAPASPSGQTVPHATGAPRRAVLGGLRPHQVHPGTGSGQQQQQQQQLQHPAPHPPPAPIESSNPTPLQAARDRPGSSVQPTAGSCASVNAHPGPSPGISSSGRIHGRGSSNSGANSPSGRSLGLFGRFLHRDAPPAQATAAAPASPAALIAGSSTDSTPVPCGSAPRLLSPQEGVAVACFHGKAEAICTALREGGKHGHGPSRMAGGPSTPSATATGTLSGASTAPACMPSSAAEDSPRAFAQQATNPTTAGAVHVEAGPLLDNSAPLPGGRGLKGVLRAGAQAGGTPPALWTSDSGTPVVLPLDALHRHVVMDRAPADSGRTTPTGRGREREEEVTWGPVSVSHRLTDGSGRAAAGPHHAASETDVQARSLAPPATADQASAPSPATPSRAALWVQDTPPSLPGDARRHSHFRAAGDNHDLHQRSMSAMSMQLGRYVPGRAPQDSVTSQHRAVRTVAGGQLWTDERVSNPASLCSTGGYPGEVGHAGGGSPGRQRGRRNASYADLSHIVSRAVQAAPQRKDGREDTEARSQRIRASPFVAAVGLLKPVVHSPVGGGTGGTGGMPQAPQHMDGSGDVRSGRLFSARKQQHHQHHQQHPSGPLPLSPGSAPAFLLDEHHTGERKSPGGDAAAATAGTVKSRSLQAAATAAATAAAGGGDALLQALAARQSVTYYETEVVPAELPPPSLQPSHAPVPRDMRPEGQQGDGGSSCASGQDPAREAARKLEAALQKELSRLARKSDCLQAPQPQQHRYLHLHSAHRPGAQAPAAAGPSLRAMTAATGAAGAGASGGHPTGSCSPSPASPLNSSAVRLSATGETLLSTTSAGRGRSFADLSAVLSQAVRQDLPYGAASRPRAATQASQIRAAPFAAALELLQQQQQRGRAVPLRCSGTGASFSALHSGSLHSGASMTGASRPGYKRSELRVSVASPAPGDRCRTTTSSLAGTPVAQHGHVCVNQGLQSCPEGLHEYEEAPESYSLHHYCYYNRNTGASPLYGSTPTLHPAGAAAAAATRQVRAPPPLPLPGEIDSCSGNREKDRRVLELASGAVQVTQVREESGGEEEGVTEDVAVSAACAAAAAMAAAACGDAPAVAGDAAAMAAAACGDVEAQFMVLRTRRVRKSSTWAHSQMAGVMAAGTGVADAVRE